jgi:hypothetical protein
LINSFIAFANGVYAGARHLVSPVMVAVVVVAASLVWLALIESDELDRTSTKPDVGVH